MDTLIQSRPAQQINTFDKFADKRKGTNLQDYNDNVLQTEEKSFIDPKYDQEKVENSIQQLRVAIKDCKLPFSFDEYLYKWLLVNGFDVARAEKMLRQSLEWRRVNEVDNILETYTPCEILKKYFSLGQVGVDKFGCPVFVQCNGRVDVKGVLMSVLPKDIFKFQFWVLENFVRATQAETERTGKRVTQATHILDYEGFSMSTLACKQAADLVMAVSKFLFKFYPDSSRRLFIINAPPFSPLMMALLKPFLHDIDVPKIKIFGSDKKQWTAALLEEIEADQLPAFYGGTMTDPDGDPKCPSKFNMGGKVPSSCYLSNNLPVAKDYMQTVSVGAGGRKKLKFDVDVARSILKWEFMTEGGDIRYRICNKNSDVTKEVVPLSQVDSHLAMEEGEIIISEPGQYLFEFDNTFSYLRSKKLRYHVLVDPPMTSENLY